MSLVLLIKGRKSILKTKKIVFIEFTIIKPITYFSKMVYFSKYCEKKCMEYEYLDSYQL